MLGVKGCCTTLPEQDLGNQGVIARKHDLWQVEKAFRLAKSDLVIRLTHHTKKLFLPRWSVARQCIA